MKRFSLRMPDDLHAALQRSAQKEYRSLHNQILIVLEEYIRQVEFKDLETILEPSPTVVEIADRLMIMDGDNNELVNLLELPAQALAVFGTRNRHFLRVWKIAARNFKPWQMRVTIFAGGDKNFPVRSSIHHNELELDCSGSGSSRDVMILD
jgi:hypothetical protein